MKNGFSLIEVIVSMALVISALLLFAVSLATIPLVKQSRAQNIAFHIATKKIEELRATPFASMPPSGPFSDPGLSRLASSTATLTLADYQGSAEIRHATVNISWDDNGQMRTVELDTLISHYGIGQ